MEAGWLDKLFEHNNWANQRLIAACAGLADAQLDAPPQPAARGSVRQTLLHLVTAQQAYVNLLTEPVETRREVVLAFAELAASARASGAALLQLARDEASGRLSQRRQTLDGYWVEPWVVLVQAINHASEHREQISAMLTALGITPPNMDGWGYGEAAGALVPLAKPENG